MRLSRPPNTAYFWLAIRISKSCSLVWGKIKRQWLKRGSVPQYKSPQFPVLTLSLNNKSLQCYEFKCVAQLIANNTDTHFWFWWIREYGSKVRHAVNSTAHLISASRNGRNLVEFLSWRDKSGLRRSTERQSSCFPLLKSRSEWKHKKTKALIPNKALLCVPSWKTFQYSIPELV